MTGAPAPTELAVETLGLTRRFGAHAAVHGVDLAVPRGSVFGFLGPNGSGKTTTIRMLLGLAAPSAGEIRVLGEDMPRRLKAVLPRVGALVEGPAFYPFLSGTANLHRLDTANPQAAGRTRTDRVRVALSRVGLSHTGNKKVHAYSLGMKQRLGLANALLSPRELLVLDEPTNGLDPQGTREVRNLVRSLAADGATVLVSSHLLSEIEQMCTHVGVMSAGRLVAQGTLAELRVTSEPSVRVVTPDADLAERVLGGLGLIPALIRKTDPSPAGDMEQIVTAALTDVVSPEQVVAALVVAGVRVRGFALASASLEERFVELTGEGFDVVQ